MFLTDRIFRAYYLLMRYTSRERWRRAYYRILPELTLGDKWKLENRPGYIQRMKEDPLGLVKYPWSRTFLYIRYRIFNLIFGIGYMEYFDKEYYKHGFKYANSCGTQFRITFLKRYFNRNTECHLINDKAKFAEFMGEFYGRKYSCGHYGVDDFVSVFTGGEDVIVKEIEGKKGEGISFTKVDPENPANTYWELVEKYDTDFIVEELVEQKGIIHDLNPSSVNTIRVISLRSRKTGKVSIVNTYARRGAPGSKVDNLHAGGGRTDIDVKTGRMYPIIDKLTARRLPDPEGIPLSSGEVYIPFWDEAMEYIRKAHSRAPLNLDFIGWDLVISIDNDKPKFSLIEANVFPGFGMPVGGMSTWEEILKVVRENFGVKPLTFYKRGEKHGRNWKYDESRPIDAEGEQILTEYMIRKGHRTPDFRNPKKYSEKIQWMKLYDATPLKTKLADKIAVRDFIKETIGEEYLIPLVGTYSSPDEIDFDKLPEKYVIKTNHGYAQNIIVNGENKLDIAEAKKQMAYWLSRNHAYEALEMQYMNIKPTLLIEEYMENDNSDLYDYKVFCFDGKPKYIEFIQDRAEGLKKAFFDTEWNLQDFTTGGERVDREVPKPPQLEKMLELAEILSQGFIHVRVDFYLLNDGSIKFGEMTFAPASGSSIWDPPEMNLEMGKNIHLPI